MGKLYAIYFSATDTTHRCAASFCQGFEATPHLSINLADNLAVTFPEISEEDVVVIASPVYGGRIPAPVADALARLKGNNAVAIAIAVYGNRDYDDALLELTDLLHNNNFRIAGAGAFIGQHSIFPKVATSRPDDTDKKELMRFGKESAAAVSNGFDSSHIPFIKGKHPYKKPAGAPLWPKAKETDCSKCGKCVRHCPAGAIHEDKPFTTDTSKCISCGRCIFVCSTGARRHTGITYSLIGLAFNTAFSKRKTPKWVVAQ